MTSGPFKHMRHEHFFEPVNGATIMTDKFEFKIPFGILGKLVDKLVFSKYLLEILVTRNQVIKEFAESGKWKKLAHL